FENPNADPHPFVPNLYEVRGTREAAEANAKAASSLQASRSAGNVSGQYLANTVLFATVLFFASASGKFEQRRVRVVAFAFAVAVFLFPVFRTAMLPRLRHVRGRTDVRPTSDCHVISHGSYAMKLLLPGTVLLLMVS